MNTAARQVPAIDSLLLVARVRGSVRISASHSAFLARTQEDVIALPYGYDEDVARGVEGR